MFYNVSHITDYWGPMTPQICMEESGELIQAVSKMERCRQRDEYDIIEKRQGLIDEIGDMYICLEMLVENYGISDDEIKARIDKKLNMTR